MKPTPVIAFCPGHISGYFRRIEGASSASTGSISAGIVISTGVTVSVFPAVTTSICIRQKEVTGRWREVARTSTPLEYILERLGLTAAVKTESELPIGAGFGLSAAALLATLTALNRLFNLGLTPHGVAELAHETEVIHRTGLGDVAACQGGGRVLRKGPGIDGEIERIFDLTEPLYAVSFGPIATPTILGSQERLEQISSAFPTALPRDPGEFFRISLQFARSSGLVTPEVQQVLVRCAKENIPASMTMLGNGVFACGRKARALLMNYGDVHEFRMATSGTCILKEEP